MKTESDKAQEQKGAADGYESKRKPAGGGGGREKDRALPEREEAREGPPARGAARGSC